MQKEIFPAPIITKKIRPVSFGPSVSTRQFRPISFGPSVSARQFRNMSFHQLVAMGWIALLREAAECHKANPDNHLRLIGYDNLKQTQGASMVVYRGKGF